MFSRKQKKLDPLVRFQQQSFTRKLDEQRNYKRTASARPEHDSRNFLYKIGLKTRLSQIIVALILAAIVYIVFIPNFLFVKTINVQGAIGDNASAVRSAVTNYFDHTPFYNPQRNLIFLNKDALKQSLLRDPKVYQVTSIKKSLFRSSLTITVEPKTETYLLNHNGVFYTLYNDGTVASEANVDAAQWLNAAPESIKIKDTSLASVFTGEKYLDDDFMAALNYTRNNFVAQVMADIDYIEIPSQLTTPPVDATATASLPITPPAVETLPLHPGDFYIFAKKGDANYKGATPDFKVIVETKQDLHDAFDKLHFLMTQTSSDRFAKLVYVDMRFDGKSFLCLAGSACAQDQNVIAPQPTPVVAPPTNNPK